MSTIKSTQLGREEYKTMAAYKGQYTKERNRICEHIQELRQRKAQGWDLYLGDPLKPQLFKMEGYLKKLDHEYMTITGINPSGKKSIWQQ